MPIDATRSLSRRSALRNPGGAGAAAVFVTRSRELVLAQDASPVATPGAFPPLLQAWAAGWSAVGDPSLLLTLVTDDIVFEDVAVGDVVRGIAGFRALLAEASTAIPDFRLELLTGLVSDTAAAAEYALSGAQTGDLPYLPASGRSFRLRATSFFELAGGRIRRESRYYDMVSFLTQLGGLSSTALPPLGTPPPIPGG